MITRLNKVLNEKIDDFEIKDKTLLKIVSLK